MRFFTLCLVITSTVPACLHGQITWTKHTINANYNGACCVYAQDINGDSVIDVLGTAIHANSITYWQNDGGSPVTWTEYPISNNFLGACYVYADDIDGDTDIDILGGAWYGNEIAWWRNDGGNPIVWTKQSIDTTFTNVHEVFATDMDADGDIDVLGAAAELDEIAWWRNDGGDPIVWIKHVIDSTFDGARSVYAVDMNGDSLIDVVGAALLSNDITVWYNNGDSTWTKQIVDDYFAGAHKVYACDLDDDSDIDILGAAYSANAITWWRNNGGNPIYWEKLPIDNSFAGALTVYATDVDGDDDTDVMGAANYADDVAWWENDGDEHFTKHMVDANFNGAWPVFAADIDGDDDTDILSAADAADDVAWWENTPVGIKEDRTTTLTNRNYYPTIINGPIVLPPDKRTKIFDITGKETKLSQMGRGIFFIKTEDNEIQKVVKIK